METTLDTIHSPSSSASSPSPSTPARRGRWGGRLVTGVPVLFLAFDVAIKLVDPPMVAQASA
ncbi:MAG TPA: hypothetical protein VK601_02260, partial [Kofleriaceae bacterium]|nr:hypothetical protein [Kofleriaceae bacterium]